jgi:predicted 3-demethylubiquinone-9 3-methyltransferase (glyoxalase superfamily)
LGAVWTGTTSTLTAVVAEAKRAFAAMMDMGKIEIAKVEAARRG